MTKFDSSFGEAESREQFGSSFGNCRLRSRSLTLHTSHNALGTRYSSNNGKEPIDSTCNGTRNIGPRVYFGAAADDRRSDRSYTRVRHPASRETSSATGTTEALSQKVPQSRHNLAPLFVLVMSADRGHS